VQKKMKEKIRKVQAFDFDEADRTFPWKKNQSVFRQESMKTSGKIRKRRKASRRR
jgi:hypothetical protein